MNSDKMTVEQMELMDDLLASYFDDSVSAFNICRVLELRKAQYLREAGLTEQEYFDERDRRRESGHNRRLVRDSWRAK